MKFKKGDRVRVFCVNASYTSDNWGDRIPDNGSVTASSFDATVVETFDRGQALRVKYDHKHFGYNMVHIKACRRLVRARTGTDSQGRKDG